MLSEKKVRENLERLVAERKAEIQAELNTAKGEAEAIEKRGGQSSAELKTVLKEAGVDIDVLRGVEEPKENFGEKRQQIRDRLKTLARQPLNEGPSLLVAFSASRVGGGTAHSCPAQYLTPYYTAVYNPSGKQIMGDYFAGRIDVRIDATGSGQGLFGGGVGRGCINVDRWFVFAPDVSRYYSSIVYEPFFGFYIVEAHDGFVSSKEAKAEIHTAVRGYQYYWKSKRKYSVLSVAGRNIDTDGRYDETDTFDYAEQFTAGDPAYLVVTQKICVYARGGGSYSELNFDSGEANYLPPPYIFVY
ncbi:MAG: hypothetical protein WD669_01320 [Pirellulales bacterium]